MNFWLLLVAEKVGEERAGWAFSFEGVATGRLLMWMAPKERNKALATIEERNEEEKEEQKTNKNNLQEQEDNGLNMGDVLEGPGRVV